MTCTFAHSSSSDVIIHNLLLSSPITDSFCHIHELSRTNVRDRFNLSSRKMSSKVPVANCDLRVFPFRRKIRFFLRFQIESISDARKCFSFLFSPTFLPQDKSSILCCSNTMHRIFFLFMILHVLL